LIFYDPEKKNQARRKGKRQKKEKIHGPKLSQIMKTLMKKTSDRKREKKRNPNL